MAVASVKAADIPRSAFAELLRRSRFSSYDPAIAQTYSAPPASARRGNYGLKRAIPMPYKDSYISVPTFEHHAHFTEWNNAEQQVKFVTRMEELNVCPQPLPRSSWHQSLGDAQYQWLVDSDFAQYSLPDSDKDKASPPSPPVSKGTPDDLRSFGKQGPGQYGARRPLPGFSAVQLNVHALSPKKFQRYLSQLRKLGPEFRAYLNQQYRSRRETQFRAATTEDARSRLAEELPNRDLDKPDDLLLFVAAQGPLQKLHRQFLTKQFSKNFAEKEGASSLSASSKIEAQPHRNGGLSYTHVSDLQSVVTSPPLPGITLQENPRTASHFSQERTEFRSTLAGTEYLVLLGDFIARLPNKSKDSLQAIYHPNTQAGVSTVRPLEPTTTTTTTTSSTSPELNFDNATATFRITRCVFKQLPKVVSYKNQRLHPDELLNEMTLFADVIPDVPLTKRPQLDNPHKPGSPHYISHISTSATMTPHYASSSLSGRSSIEMGSQFAARNAAQRKRDSANRHWIIAEATDRAKMTTDINEMGMGMDMGYSLQNRAKLTTTLSSIVLGGSEKKMSDEDDDEDL